MKALLLSIRTILRFRTYTAINVLGLALSLGCVFVLVRYIHQERTVNHFVPEADRTFLTAVFKEGEPRGSLGESGDRNNDPNYRNPLDHPAVEAFSRFMMFDDDFVTKDDYRYAVNTMVVDSLFFDLISYGCKEGSLQLKPDEALLTPQAALRIFGTEHAVGKELVTSSGKPVRVAGILREPSTKSSFQFDVVLSVYLMKDWSRVAYEVVRLHRPEDGDEINRANRTPMKLICYGVRAVYYQLVPLKDFYLNRQVSAFADSVTQGRSDVLRLLGLVAGLILLVGLLNYMNLYSVVMLKRGRELGMKKVLGAGKGQIFLQLYAENVCLNAAVVFLAWLLVEVTRRLVDAWFDIPVQGDLRFDLLLSAVVLFLLPLFTMLPPYWRYAHAAPMRSLSQVGVGGKATRSRTVFLFLQYVIAFCLTVAAIYLSRHLQFLLHTDVGYRTEDIIQCPFWKENPAASNNWEIRQQEMKKKNAAFALLEKRIGESPLFTGMTYGIPPYDLQPDTRFRTDDGQEVEACHLWASREYMDFFGFRLLEGRRWNEDEDEYACKLIANRAFLQALHIQDWRTEKVTPNQRFWYRSGENWNEIPSYDIIGVVEDFRTGHLSGGNQPVVFIYQNGWRDFTFLSIAPGKRKEAIAFLNDLYQEAVGRGDFEYSLITDEIARLHEEDRKVTRIVITFALIAIGISCLGLFGLSLYDIRQRYREIALRKVHGAQVSDICRLLLCKYMILLGLAFVAGSAVAYIGISHYMERFPHHASLAPWIFLVAGLIVTLIALITVIWQIYRASQVNPAEVIKRE